jgi:hypothetical protein
MLFPVFGRGRVLYALVGGGIEPANIEKAARFLIEGCSCIVKRDNPGTGLLLDTDWSAFGAADEADTPLAGRSVPPPRRPDAQPPAAPPSEEGAGSAWPRRLLWPGLAGAAVLAAVCAREVLRRRRPAGHA